MNVNVKFEIEIVLCDRNIQGVAIQDKRLKRSDSFRYNLEDTSLHVELCR